MKMKSRCDRFYSLTLKACSPLTLIYILLIGTSTSSNADDYPFARVFTTAEQRQALDQNREKLLSGKEMVELDTVVVSTQNIADDKFVLSGLLIRGDGKTQVWVNGESELSENKQTYGRYRLREQALADKRVRLRYDDKYRTMKPGQVWMVDEGVVKELHQVQKPLTSNNEAVESVKINAENRSIEDANKAVADAEKQSDTINDAMQKIKEYRNLN